LRTFVYDNVNDSNFLAASSRTKKYFEDDPNINEFQIKHFNYPVTRFPRLIMAYNPDDGFMAGAGFWITRYGFRKTPHASDHEFNALAGLSRKAIKMNYRGEIVQAFASMDVMFDAQVSLPVLNNFFGFGNSTVIDKSKPISYYRVRYKFAEGDILLRKRYFNKLSIMAGPAVYHYWNDYENNRNYILGKPADEGDRVEAEDAGRQHDDLRLVQHGAQACREAHDGSFR
jgi:hypothetical protein